MVLMEHEDKIERCANENGEVEVEPSASTLPSTSTNGAFEEASSSLSTPSTSSSSSTSNQAHEASKSCPPIVSKRYIRLQNGLKQLNNNNNKDKDDDSASSDSSEDSIVSVVDVSLSTPSTSTTIRPISDNSCDADGDHQATVDEEDGTADTLKPIFAMFRHPAISKSFSGDDFDGDGMYLDGSRKSKKPVMKGGAKGVGVEPKMGPPVMILTQTDNSIGFEEKRITLEQPVKVGRAIAKTTPDNAIFKCKVLSRSHALIWFELGRFYIKDTNSSNGTFVNGTKLITPDGSASGPCEIFTGDILQFGLEVTERDKVHQCVIASVQLFTPDGAEHKTRAEQFGVEITHPVGPCVEPSPQVSSSQLVKLAKLLQYAHDKQAVMAAQLERMRKEMETAKEMTNKTFVTMVHEDQLLSRVESLQSKVETLMLVADENRDESTLEVKIQLLKEQLLNLIEDKENLEKHCKASLQKALEEKTAAFVLIKEIEERLAGKVDECSRLRETCEKKSRELLDLAKSCDILKEERDELEEKIKRLEKEWPSKLKEIDQQRKQLEAELKRTIEESEKTRHHLPQPKSSKPVKFEDELFDLWIILERLRQIEPKSLQRLNVDQIDSLCSCMLDVLQKIPSRRSASDDENLNSDKNDSENGHSSQHRKLERLIMSNGKGAIRLKTTDRTSDSSFATDLLKKLKNLENEPSGQSETQKFEPEVKKPTEGANVGEEENTNVTLSHESDATLDSRDLTSDSLESKKTLDVSVEEAEEVKESLEPQESNQRLNPFNEQPTIHSKSYIDNTADEEEIICLLDEILDENEAIEEAEEGLLLNLNDQCDEMKNVDIDDQDLLMFEEGKEFETELDIEIESDSKPEVTWKSDSKLEEVTECDLEPEAMVQSESKVTVQSEPQLEVSDQSDLKLEVTNQSDSLVSVPIDSKLEVAIQSDSIPKVADQIDLKPEVSVQIDSKQEISVQTDSKPEVTGQSVSNREVSVQRDAELEINSEIAHFDTIVEVNDNFDEDGDVRIVQDEDDEENDPQKQAEKSLDELEEELDLELMESVDQATQVGSFTSEYDVEEDSPIKRSMNFDIDDLRQAVKLLAEACHSESMDSTDSSPSPLSQPETSSNVNLIETLHQLTDRVVKTRESHSAELTAIRAEISALTYQNQLSFAMATLPLILILIAIIAAFYPILSFLMGTSDR